VRVPRTFAKVSTSLDAPASFPRENRRETLNATNPSQLPVRDVARFLRVSTRTVYAMCAQGRLAHVRVMNAIRIDPAAIAPFVSSMTQ
jgi:excisionase family DNA binding protein